VVALIRVVAVIKCGDQMSWAPDGLGISGAQAKLAEYSLVQLARNCVASEHLHVCHTHLAVCHPLQSLRNYIVASADK
jgi:hypothetical protein